VGTDAGHLPRLPRDVLPQGIPEIHDDPADHPDVRPTLRACVQAVERRISAGRWSPSTRISETRAADRDSSD